MATSADVFSQWWNPSKYIFSEEESGLSISYLPYARNVSRNLFITGVTYFKKASDVGVWGASLKYFNLGEIDLNHYQAGQVVSLGMDKPSELTLDLSYSLKLSDPFALGISAKFLRSDLGRLNEFETINSVAFDIGAFYESQNNDAIVFRHGLVISNLGPRVRYNEADVPSYIPTLLKLGTGMQFNYENDQTLEVSVELNKLMVPIENDRNIGFVRGIFSSFNDAPGGFEKEMEEVTLALGAEYTIKKRFVFRAGYFNQSLYQGNLKYYSLGTGFEKSGFRFDFSYLLNASNVSNQLQNSLRLSLGIPLDFKIQESDNASEGEELSEEGESLSEEG